MSQFTLRFDGNRASDGEVDFYDVSKAMLGFQRSLALTAHFAFSGEIITQAPSLRNAQIFALPPRQGSWEIGAVLLAAIGGALVAPKDTVIGHFTRSLYDYLLNATLGIDVDFDKTIRNQYKELCNQNNITEERVDSLIEKTEAALIDLHRPIVKSQTARLGSIRYGINKTDAIGPTLTPETFEYVSRTIKLKTADNFYGVISSYNSNTFRGRIFLGDEQRPVPFELADDARNLGIIRMITESLSLNALDRSDQRAALALRAIRHISPKGRLKSLYVVEVHKGVAL